MVHLLYHDLTLAFALTTLTALGTTLGGLDGEQLPQGILLVLITFYFVDFLLPLNTPITATAGVTSRTIPIIPLVIVVIVVVVIPIGSIVVLHRNRRSGGNFARYHLGNR